MVLPSVFMGVRRNRSSFLVGLFLIRSSCLPLQLDPGDLVIALFGSQNRLSFVS